MKKEGKNGDETQEKVALGRVLNWEKVVASCVAFRRCEFASEG